MKIFENNYSPQTNFNRFVRVYLIFLCLAWATSTSLWAQTSKGVASFYGNKFKGRKTSSGERYHPDSMTAAHKTLPFGTLVKVTNPRNGHSTLVKVNDRLPKKSKRIIDLSKKAARELDMIKQGIVKVELEVVR
jgi:rare lipoprotein A